MDELLRFITMLIPVYFSNIRSIFHFIYWGNIVLFLPDHTQLPPYFIPAV